MKPASPPAPLKFVINITYGESNPPPPVKSERRKNVPAPQHRHLPDEAG
jgi:hypothetical protein